MFQACDELCNFFHVRRFIKWDALQKKRHAERAERRTNRLQQGGGEPPPQT